MNEKLFIYGTLMEGEAQAGLLGDAARAVATVRGSLWNLPAGYPAMSGGDGVVHGELVELNHPAMLRVLDRYEGVEDGLYQRVLVDVLVGLRPHRAWAYVMADPRLRGGWCLRSGRWRAVRRR